MRTQAAMMVVALLLALAALWWAMFAIGIPFEEGGGPLCIGTTADIAQQALAVGGVIFAVTALVAGAQKKRKLWMSLTLGAVALFGLWQVLTRVTAAASC